MTAGTGRMRIVASENLGELGRAESEPVLLNWRWYHYVPGLPPWIVLGLLLVLPRHNRNRQAWLILILPLLVAAFWQLILAALPEPSAELGFAASFVTALAIAWASMWLLGPWLCVGGRAGTSFLGLAAMLAVGAVAYFGYFGVRYSSDAPSLVVFWSAWPVSLAAAMALSGFCCRRVYRPGYMMLWLLLWMPVASAACMSVVAASLVAWQPELRDSPGQLLVVFISCMAFSLMMAGMLYVFNLPVMILARACPCYRERLHQMYRLPRLPSR
jgi:hypothetical protein